MNRRRFLQTAAATVAARVAAAQAGGIKIGYDTYTLRSFQWKALRHLEYCSRLKLDALQISSLNDYESLDPEHLQQVKDRAARQSVTIDAGIGCICPTANGWNSKEGTPPQYLIKGMRVAKAVGAKSMRCFIGNPQDRRGPLRAYRKHVERAARHSLAGARSGGQDRH